MRKISLILLMATAITLTLTTSCSKETIPQPQSQAPTEAIQYLQLPLQVEAGANVTKATFTVYDEDFVAVYSGEKVIPANGVVTLDFLAEGDPKYLGVPGLANGDPDTGLLQVGGKSIQTKADGGRILVVIR